MSIHVLKSGLLDCIQDRGRIGHAALGVGRSGAMDLPALRIANALVGNNEEAAAIEINLSGPRLHFECAARVALCGADVEASLDADPIAMWRAIDAAAGSALDCRRMRHGGRAYLAIAGGVRSPRVLGSVAADINAGLGAAPLRAGDIVYVEDAQRTRVPSASTHADNRWSIDPRPWFDADLTRPLRLIRGSHFDALDGPSRNALFASSFRIAHDSNRVGLRLDGTALTLARPLELVSEPVTHGTLQLPPGGQPIVLMTEHPTTGGYPRIGQVAAVDLPRLAQRRPGDPVRFVEIDLDDALARYRVQQTELGALIVAIHERLSR